MWIVRFVRPEVSNSSKMWIVRFVRPEGVAWARGQQGGGLGSRAGGAEGVAWARGQQGGRESGRAGSSPVIAPEAPLHRICKVLPDNRPVTQNADGEINVERTAMMDERLKSFLKEKADQTSAAAKVSFHKRYATNVDHLKALDHSLQGTFGFSLKSFECERPPRARAKDEKRYFVKAADLPPDLCRDLGLESRSCIHDQVTGKRFLEVLWTAERKCLFQVLDCGASAWPGKFFLYSEAAVRGGFMGDPCHTRFNRFKTAVRKVGLWGSWLEGSLINGLRRGPLAGASNFATLSSTASSMFESSDYKDPLFKHCYVPIALHFFKGNLPMDVHSEGIMKLLWDSLPRAGVFHRKGSTQKSSRWFQWLVQMEDISLDLGFLWMVLCRVCIERNYVGTLDDLASDHVRPAPVQAEAPVPAEPDRRVAGANSETALADKEMKAARKKTRNNLHLACKILNTDLQVSLIKMIYIVGRVSKERHGTQAHMCKTQLGGLHWFAGECSRFALISDSCLNWSGNHGAYHRGKRIDGQQQPGIGRHLQNQNKGNPIQRYQPFWYLRIGLHFSGFVSVSLFLVVVAHLFACPGGMPLITILRTQGSRPGLTGSSGRRQPLICV
jgi:hypothetical protein